MALTQMLVEKLQ